MHLPIDAPSVMHSLAGKTPAANKKGKIFMTIWPTPQYLPELPDFKPGTRVDVKTMSHSLHGKPYELTVVEVGEFLMRLKGPRGGKFDLMLHATRPYALLFRGSRDMGAVTSIGLT